MEFLLQENWPGLGQGNHSEASKRLHEWCGKISQYVLGLSERVKQLERNEANSLIERSELKSELERVRQIESSEAKSLNEGNNGKKNDVVEDKIRYEEQKARLDELETKLQKIKSAEEETIKSTIEAKGEAWSTIVSKKVDKELKLVSDKVKQVEEKMKIREEEDKQKELKKNNIIIHRMAESTVMEGEKKNSEDRKAIISLINDVLKVPCEDKDIKRIFRLGKVKDTERPLLIEFQEGTMKNIVLESLSKLRLAEEKYRKISVTKDPKPSRALK